MESEWAGERAWSPTADSRGPFWLLHQCVFMKCEMMDLTGSKWKQWLPLMIF